MSGNFDECYFLFLRSIQFDFQLAVARLVDGRISSVQKCFPEYLRWFLIFGEFSLFGGKVFCNFGIIYWLVGGFVLVVRFSSIDSGWQVELTAL